jgi:hypothetical protein
MRLVRLVVLAVVASVAASGCDSCASQPSASAGFFGAAVEPPRGLSRLRPGMSVTEARKLVPELKEPDKRGVREELVVDSGVSDVSLAVRVDAGTVSAIVAIVSGHEARALLTQAWGPPQIVRDALGQPEVTWASEATAWKAKLDCLERNCVVEFHPYHALTAAFFGAHVAPPGELAKLHIGMKVLDARQVAPAPVSVRSGIDTGVDGVRQFVAIDDKLGTVRSIYLNLPKDAPDVIAEAWGASQTATDLVGKSVLVWHDPATGWRATLREALGYSFDLAFDNYMPAGKLLGETADGLDALPSPVLGKTVEEVKKAYKDAATVQGHDVTIQLLPTEWDRFWTRVSVGVSAGKVHELSFALPYKPHPEARDELYALFTHKWGEPQEIEDEGQAVLLFREADPRVEVRDDVVHGAWRFELR